MVIFDLDGTLYRTHETGLPILRELCREYGVKLTPEDERYLLYTTTNALLNKVAPDMPEETRERFRYEFKRREIGNVKSNGRLFDGIEALLDSLASDGIDMAMMIRVARPLIEDSRAMKVPMVIRTLTISKLERMIDIGRLPASRLAFSSFS